MYISGLVSCHSIIRLQSVGASTTIKMKTFVCVLLLAALVAAEPPRFRQARFRVTREEAEEGSGNKESDSENKDAPYPAAGYRPSKEFTLPSRQELAPPSTSYGTPDTSYGAPLNTYLVPQTEYGVPQAESRNNEGEKKEEDSETVESEGKGGEEEGEKKEDEKEKLEESPKKDVDVVNSQGAYYVLLPGSQLQRVQFQTENDLTNMAYTARLQYRNEDRAPIYFYTAVPQYQSSAAYNRASAAYYQPSATYYQPSAAYGTW